MPAFRKFFTRQMKWVVQTAQAAAADFNALLLEDGGYFLMESGDKLILGGDYLLSDNLDYANAAAAAAAGWVDSPSVVPTWHYTTAPAPIDGISSSSLALVDYSSYTTRSFAPSDEIWIYIVWNFAVDANNPYIVQILDSSDAIIGAFRIISAFSSRGYHGTINKDNAVTVTTGTKHIWLRWKKSPTAGILEWYINTTSTKPAMTDSITNGDSNVQASKIRFTGGTSGTEVHIYNKLRVSTTTIDSSPS